MRNLSLRAKILIGVYVFACIISAVVLAMSFGTEVTIERFMVIAWFLLLSGPILAYVVYVCYDKKNYDWLMWVWLAMTIGVLAHLIFRISFADQHIDYMYLLIWYVLSCICVAWLYTSKTRARTSLAWLFMWPLVGVWLCAWSVIPLLAFHERIVDPDTWDNSPTRYYRFLEHHPRSHSI